MDVKYIQHCIGPSHKVWMVGVNVGVFNDNQVLDHLVSGSEALVQQLVHYLNHFLPQSLKPFEFRHVDFINYPS